VCTQTTLINPKETIYWNIDKHYLQDIEKKGVRIPKTVFIEPNDTRSLRSIVDSLDWKEFILKPAISGSARHTYRFTSNSVDQHEDIFKDLISSESLLLQEFQNNILTQGEAAFILFGGKYSHAVLKKAKPGDFRVQDDFGGSLHDYEPSPSEIVFIEKAIKACHPTPVYARVDVIRNNEDQLCIGEIELIEPELWFRREAKAADRCAQAIVDFINN
jgi:glutathione synthase/RimK-type ligase-like ATP-grasp enzyme